MGAALGMLRQKIASSCGFFDADGTWSRWPLYLDVYEEMVVQGLFPRIMLTHIEKVRSEYKRRQGGYEDFMERAVQLFYYDGRLRGIRLVDMELCAQRVIKRKGDEVYVFTRELARAAKQIGMHRAIISGSPAQIVKAFAEANGIKICLGTEMDNDAHEYTGGGPTRNCWVHNKDEAVRKIAAEYEFDLAESFAIGDTMSDVKMLMLVRYPLCFKPPRELRNIARARGWPIISEEKDSIEISRPNARGRFEEVPLDEILPPLLAEEMRKRLPFLL